MTTRRNFLKGAGGVGVGLPFLPSLMRPASASCDDGIQRLVVLYQPQGMIMEEWHPTGTGSNFELSPILSPLEPIKDDIVVVSGLDNTMPTMFNNSGGHQGASKSIFTGMTVSSNLAPDGTPLPAGQQPEVDHFVGAGGPSVDQVIASRMAAPTPYESLGFAIGTTSYYEAVAAFHAGRDEVLGMEPDPREAFDRLFADFEPSEPSPMQRLRAARGSVLDSVAGSYEAVANRLSARDRQRLEAHATKIRELEMRFANGAGGGTGCDLPDFTLPGDYDPNHDDFDDVGGRAQIDNAVMALACDMTRVTSIQYTHGQGNRFPWLGHPFPFDFDGWHGIFHIVPGGPTGREDPVVRAAMLDVMRWYAEMFRYLVQRLAETPDGEGTMLDSTLVVWATEMGDGAGHNLQDIPVVLAGNLCGALETGRHMEYYGRSTNDLLVSILNAFGHEDQSFGHPELCAGPLPGLV
ncbi:MAG: DUF1552 domain-containing protein [Myxococcota bacterium]